MQVQEDGGERRLCWPDVVLATAEAPGIPPQARRTNHFSGPRLSWRDEENMGWASSARGDSGGAEGAPGLEIEEVLVQCKIPRCKLPTV